MLALPNRDVGTGHPGAGRYVLTSPQPSLSPEQVFRSALSPLWESHHQSDSSSCDSTHLPWDLWTMMSLTLEGLKIGVLLHMDQTQEATLHGPEGPFTPPLTWLPLLWDESINDQLLARAEAKSLGSSPLLPKPIFQLLQVRSWPHSHCVWLE